MTDAESLAAAAADECRRIIEEKDRKLEQARDERDAARAWQEQVTDGLGYFNPSVIVAAWREAQQRLDGYSAMCAEQTERAEAAERALSEAREAGDRLAAWVEQEITAEDEDGHGYPPTKPAREALDAWRALAALSARLPAPVPPGETTPDPTHRCKVCDALWILNPPSRVQPDGSWSLWSKKAGPCCDNVAMGDQIEPISGFHRLCDPGPMGEPAAPAAHPETTPKVNDHE